MKITENLQKVHQCGGMLLNGGGITDSLQQNHIFNCIEKQNSQKRRIRTKLNSKFNLDRSKFTPKQIKQIFKNNILMGTIKRKSLFPF